MDKRKGRFVLSKKTMRVGTEIYKKIVDQMLLVHIAHITKNASLLTMRAQVCTSGWETHKATLHKAV